MEDSAPHRNHHQFVIRVWRETQCRKSAEWRIRIHHVRSGNVFFSTNIDQALDQLKEIIGLSDQDTC